MFTWSRGLTTEFKLGNCLFGAIKLTMNDDPDKYGFSSYSIGFDARSQYSLSDGSWGQNVVIFGVDNRSSVYFDYKKKIS